MMTISTTYYRSLETRFIHLMVCQFLQRCTCRLALHNTALFFLFFPSSSSEFILNVYWYYVGTWDVPRVRNKLWLIANALNLKDLIKWSIVSEFYYVSNHFSAHSLTIIMLDSWNIGVHGHSGWSMHRMEVHLGRCTRWRYILIAAYNCIMGWGQ